MKSKPVRLRITLVYEYDAEPEHYGNKPPAEMAATDQATFDDDLYMLAEMLAGQEYVVKVEVADGRV